MAHKKPPKPKPIRNYIRPAPWLLKATGKTTVGSDGHYLPGGIPIALNPDSRDRGRFVDRLNICLTHTMGALWLTEAEAWAYLERLEDVPGVKVKVYRYTRCWVDPDSNFTDKERLAMRDDSGKPLLRLRFKPGREKA